MSAGLEYMQIKPRGKGGELTLQFAGFGAKDEFEFGQPARQVAPQLRELASDLLNRHGIFIFGRPQLLSALLLHLDALLLHLVDLLAQIQNGTTGFVVFKKPGLGRADTKTQHSRKDSSQGKNGHGLQSFSPRLQR